MPASPSPVDGVANDRHAASGILRFRLRLSRAIDATPQRFGRILPVALELLRTLGTPVIETLLAV
jgi:hypothetical protein